MTNLEIDSQDVKDAIEKRTQFDWSIIEDKSERTKLTAVSYRLDVVWTEDKWVINLYDKATAKGDEKSIWTETDLENSVEVVDAIGTIPLRFFR